MANNLDQKKSNKNQIVLCGSALALTSLVMTQPASAQTADPVSDINDMVTNLGTITTSVVGVVIAALTVRLAVKQVNRLMTKG